MRKFRNPTFQVSVARIIRNNISGDSKSDVNVDGSGNVPRA